MTAQNLSRQIADLRKMGRPEQALALIDSQRGAMPEPAYRRFRARSLVHLDRHSDALEELDNIPTPKQVRADVELRVKCLLALGRTKEAGALVTEGRATLGDGYVGQLGLLFDASFAQNDMVDVAGFGAQLRQLGGAGDARLKNEVLARLYLLDVAGLTQMKPDLGDRMGAEMVQAIRDVSRRNAPTCPAAPSKRDLADLVIELLQLFDDAQDLGALRFMLKSALSEDQQARIWQRRKELALRNLPTSIWKISGDTGSTGYVGWRKFENLRLWLGQPEGWMDDVARGLKIRNRFIDALLVSESHYHEYLATQPPADWSEVIASQKQGRPAIVVVTHNINFGALMAEVVRSGLDAAIIASPDFFGRTPYFATLFPKSLGSAPSASMLARAMARQLRSGGVAIVAVDGGNGAQESYVEALDVTVNLPGEHWTTAQRFGADLFQFHVEWDQGRMVSSVECWDQPETRDPSELKRLWYEKLIGRIRQSYLADPRNVAGVQWFKHPGRA